MYTLLFPREAKPHSNPKNLADVIPGFGGVVSAKVNCAGNRVSIQTVTVSTAFIYFSYICCTSFPSIFKSLLEHCLIEFFSSSISHIVINLVYRFERLNNALILSWNHHIHLLKNVSYNMYHVSQL